MRRGQRLTRSWNGCSTRHRRLGRHQINLLDSELLTIKLRLLVASVDKPREMGIDSQLIERQALRRVDHGSLSEDEIERLGTTFIELDRRMEELRKQFGLTAEDLNLDLGPLGRLL